MKLHPADIAKEIKNYIFFESFNDSLLLQFATMLRVKNVPANTIILQEGSENNILYFLRSGAVEISLSNEVITQISTEGEVFGEMSVVTKNPVSTTVKVTKDSHFFVVSTEDLNFVNPKEKDHLQALLYQVYCLILSKRLSRTNEKARLFEILNREIHEAQKSIGKTVSASVLLIEPDLKKQITVKMALGGTGLRLQVAKDGTEAKEFLATNHYDIIMSDELFVETLKHANSLPNPPTVVLIMCAEMNKTIQVLDANRFIMNAISRQNDDRNVMIRYLITALSKIINKDLFGISKYLLWGAEIQTAKITGSVQRHELREKVEQHFREMGVRGSVLDRVNSALEEMLMNAIYDAPTDSHGNPQFNHLSRKNEIRLDTHQQSQLSYASDGFILAVSVTDPFGSITSDIIIDYLKSCYGDSAGALNSQKGGAGRGLHQIVEASDVTIFNVKKGVRTEVVCLFYIDGKKREFHPTMHYFFQ